jgi:hypothetical protein
MYSHKHNHKVIKNLLSVATSALALRKAEVEEKGLKEELEPVSGDERNCFFKEELSWIWILHSIRKDSNSWKRKQCLLSWKSIGFILLKPPVAIDGHSS